MASEDLGHFVWYDLMTSDPAAAEAFYGQLIGWGTQEWEAGEQPYTMWTNNDTPLGGVMKLSDDVCQAGVPPHWMAYVAVEDVAVTAKEVTDAGGSVLHEPTDIPGAGSFAVLSDPQGAAFAVHSSAAEDSQADPEGQIGRFSWNELATTDYKGALSFYSKLFGWSPHEAMDMGEAGIYQIYGRGGDAPLGGMFNKPAEMPGPPMWLYYIKVDDVNASVAKVEELGGQVVNGPMEVPGGDLIAQCLDPQGALFALHSSG